MNCITVAEKLALEKMFPPGSRVELEYMESDPYSELIPGDLGSVIDVDDAGQIHVSWDKGGSLALVYKIDKCRCVMTKDQMDDLMRKLKSKSFQNIEEMQNWIEDKTFSAFPEMYFRRPVNNELLLELGVNAFQTKQSKIQISFYQDGEGHVIVDRVEFVGSRLQEQQRGKESVPKRF